MRRKNFFYWLCLCFIYANSSCQPTTLSEPPQWQEITIGQTTSVELVEILGEPENKFDHLDETYPSITYSYPSPMGIQTRNTLIVLAPNCDCVVFILESLISLKPSSLLTALKPYGEPEVILAGIETRNAARFVYARQGIAIEGNAQINPAEAHVFAKHYFMPTTTEEYLKKYASKILPYSDNLYLHAEWQPYAYDPNRDYSSLEP